jgi:hypothetical protein
MTPSHLLSFSEIQLLSSVFYLYSNAQLDKKSNISSIGFEKNK